MVRVLAAVRAGFVVLLMACAGSGAAAQERGVNIMGGPILSTSYEIAKDIMSLTAQCGLPATAHESQGAIDNLLELKGRRYTQFALMQTDVLEYLKTYETFDPQIGQAINGIRVAMPLFTQEVHVVGRKDIADMAGLSGKRVSIGSKESGTFYTATLIQRLLGLEFAETLTLDPIESFAAMAAGEIDAFFHVDGAPSPLLQTAEFDPDAVHLVPMEDPVLNATYSPSVVRQSTYPFVTEPVPVVAVESVLLTYNYILRGRNRYNTDNCQMVSDVTHLIARNINSLAASSHPKWAEVDLSFEVDDWLYAGCAERGLNPAYQPICK